MAHNILKIRDFEFGGAGGGGGGGEGGSVLQCAVNARSSGPRWKWGAGICRVQNTRRYLGEN